MIEYSSSLKGYLKNMIDITVPIQPTPKQSVSVNFKTKQFYQPKKKTEYVNFIKYFVGQTMLRESLLPLKGFLKIMIVCYFERPKSDKNDFPCKKKYGDWDNLAKPVCDSLNGISYSDDCYIVNGGVWKVWAEDGVARVRIILKETSIEEFKADFD